MINRLSDVVRKNPKFLEGKILITEKLDTFRFQFEKTEDGVRLFKKDNTEIDRVERTLSDTWETPMAEIPILVGESNLPKENRFGVAYTPVERPIRIPYENLPRYVVTDVTKREKNRVTKVYEMDEVQNYAAILTMGRPPVVFEGELTDEQKKVLLAYDRRNFDDTEASFSKILEKYLEGSYSGADTIEGIVLRNEDGDIAQVVSYEFALLDEAYERTETPRDLYDLIIMSINEFMDSYSVPDMEAKEDDQLYIDRICDAFNGYVKKNPVTESLKKEFITPPRYGHGGKLNKKFITNEETLKILKDGEIYESLFSLMLSSFRKFKKKYGLLTERDVQKFNFHAQNLNPMLGQLSSERIDEMWEKIEEKKHSDNVVVSALNKKKATDIDNMRVIASIQKAFEPEALDPKKGNDRCVIYFTEFLPFTNGQMENLNSIFRTWKVPILLATVSNERRVKGEKFKFSDDLVKAQMEAIKIYNKDIVADCFFVKDWNLFDVFDEARPKYEPIALITDKGKKSEFVIQLFFEEEVMGGRINADPKFNIGEMEIKDKLKTYRVLEDGLFYSFRECVPQPILGLFDSMMSELRSHTGEVLLTADSGNR